MMKERKSMVTGVRGNERPIESRKYFEEFIKVFEDGALIGKSSIKALLNEGVSTAGPCCSFLKCENVHLRKGTCNVSIHEEKRRDENAPIIIVKAIMTA